MDFSNKSRNLQIGNYLQTLRLEQNLTLEQLSNLSQVPIIHLTSIEEGRFSRFDDFYLKLYLKRFTESLNVDLEQLYIYATQQPLPDPSESAKNKQNDNERQMTETQANISATPKDVVNTTPKRKPTLKTVNIARLEAKKKISRFITGMVLLALLGLIVFFVIRIILDFADREPNLVETTPVIVNPHEIDNNNEEEEEEEEEENEEEEEEEEEEPEPEVETIIELDEHVGQVQIFNLTTSLDEIELRIEQSGSNWIGANFLNEPLFINANHDQANPLEETFSIENNAEFRLTLGAIQNVEAVFINGEEVPFISAGLNGAHNLYFMITIQTE